MFITTPPIARATICHCCEWLATGLVRVALAQGELAEALAVVDEILTYLSEQSVEGILAPFVAYLACIQALQAVNDPRMDGVVAEAKAKLEKTAVIIENPSLRASYLENVAAHRDLINL